MKFSLVLCAVVCTMLCVQAKPAQYNFNHLVADDFGKEITNCHGLVCPSGTVACSKSTKTSSDKKTLLETVQCEDHRGNVLNSETKSSENPYENTQITSFSFTGHYNINGGNSGVSVRRPPTTLDTTHYNNNHNSNSDVETFA